jgi:hypothetical protein
LLNNKKLYLLTSPNNIRIINIECLLQENIVFIDDNETKFLNTEITNTMINKLKYPLYKLKTNTLYNYVNQKTNLDFKTIENIFNNKEKRLWFFTNKRYISDIFVFPTIKYKSEEPIITDNLLSEFQKNTIINEIKKKNIIHTYVNFGVEDYIQANYFCIFYGYLTDFYKFNNKVKHSRNRDDFLDSDSRDIDNSEDSEQTLSSSDNYYVFDAEILLKKTIDNIFNSYIEYDSSKNHIQEWSTNNMIYFNKGWPYGRIGKKEEFGPPMEKKDFSVVPYKKSLVYVTEDTTLCDTISYLDTEEIRNLKIIKFINKLICKIKDIPPEKIDKNELCIRFPIGVNLSNGLFKISLPTRQPYPIRYVDTPYNQSS